MKKTRGFRFSDAADARLTELSEQSGWTRTAILEGLILDHVPGHPERTGVRAQKGTSGTQGLSKDPPSDVEEEVIIAERVEVVPPKGQVERQSRQRTRVDPDKIEAAQRRMAQNMRKK